VRGRLDHIEQVILTPVREELLEPSRIAELARRLQAHHREEAKREQQAPTEVAELDVRIAACGPA
jgi:hypothetical protein